jgi:hypothetical protein
LKTKLFQNKQNYFFMIVGILRLFLMMMYLRPSKDT